MLNLFSKFVVPGVDHVEIFQDDEDELQFWMLPGKPSPAMTDDGVPSISMMLFARDMSLMASAAEQLPRGEQEGGLLSMTLEVRVGQEDQAKIIDYIEATIMNGGLMASMHEGTVVYRRRTGASGTPRLSYPTWVDGTVKFAMLPSAGPTFLKGYEGSDKPSLTGSNLASFTMLLGQEGARLLRESLKSGVSPGGVYYSLRYQARLPNIHISITGNSEDVYNELKEHTTVTETHNGHPVRIYPQVSSLQELQTKVASLHVTYDRVDFPAMTGQDQAVADEAAKRLENLVLDIAQGYLKDRFFTPGFTPDLNKDKLGTDPLQNFKPAGTPVIGGNQLWLKDFTQSMKGTIDFTLDGRLSQPVNVQPNAKLFDMIDPAVLQARTVEADLNTPIFHRLDVPVRVTAEFEKDPIHTVQVHLDYRQTDDRPGHNETKTRSETFDFTTGREVYYFRTTMAKAADGTPKDTFTYSSTLHYRASQSEVHVPPVETRLKSLVIGYDSLSCVQVTCITGKIPWDVVERADVKLRYPGLNSPSATETVTLTSGKSEGSWFTYTNGDPSREYERQFVFTLLDGSRMELEPQRSTTARLVVDAPFDDTLTVTFTPQGAFPPISSIVLSVRYSDPANDYEVDTVHVFEAHDDPWVWKVRLRDPDLQEYRYKVDVAYADGAVDLGEWQTSGDTAKFVGEVTGATLTVEVQPALLDMTRWRLVVVRLRHTDPGTGRVTEKTFQYTAATPLTSEPWTVPLRDATAKGYTYEIHGYGVDGVKKVVGPVSTEDILLVVEL
ncbi:hypothetical protein DQ384_19750 [Sphaerisporangium album]|uniref:Uncharacterized protein n=1 Tax=Sphaerisporangium album TaxID=509200 RepID=A0A367FJ03_9ACTN|nr:hypothetical protein [Sphaerisporangium album]RCG29802.1 hypothetical protein DQ384_19750 [Sphaerisporangium album]